MSLVSQLFSDCVELYTSNPYGFANKLQSIGKLFYWHVFMKRISDRFVGSFDEMQMLYDTKSDGCAHTFFRPYLEYPLYWYTKKFVKKGDVVVDIGSNIGNYTMLSAKNGATVYAIEPNHDAVNLCRINIHLNDFSSVYIHELAVSNKKGVATFHLQELGHSGISSLLATTAGSKTIKVHTIRLDDFVKQEHIDRIHFLKIDVEGAEELVFSGAKRLLSAKKVDTIFWESNDIYQNRFPEQLIKQLEKYGYRTIVFDPKDKTLRKWAGDPNAFSYLPSKRVNTLFRDFKKYE